MRELKSAVEQALLLAPGAEITPADLFGTAEVLKAASGAAVSAPVADGGTPEGDAVASSFRAAKDRVVAAFERDFLLQALRRHGGNITKAAEEIGLYRQNFQQKMRELGITVDDADTEPE